MRRAGAEVKAEHTRQTWRRFRQGNRAGTAQPGWGRPVAMALLTGTSSACLDSKGTPWPSEPAPGDAGAEQGLPLAPRADAGVPATDGIPRFLDVPPGASLAADVLTLAAQDLLEPYCGGCHSVGEVGLNAVLFDGPLDWTRLIESGLIVPGSSESSPLLVRLLDGSVQSPGHPSALTQGDVSVLADWLDELPGNWTRDILELPNGLHASAEVAASRAAGAEPQWQSVFGPLAGQPGWCRRRKS